MRTVMGLPFEVRRTVAPWVASRNDKLVVAFTSRPARGPRVEVKPPPPNMPESMSSKSAPPPPPAEKRIRVPPAPPAADRKSVVSADSGHHRARQLTDTTHESEDHCEQHT